jgi:PmbA protein
MTQSLSDLTQALNEAAMKAGADSCDSIAIDGTSVSIDVRGGELEHAERSEGTDIGLRVIIGQKQACVSASDTSLTTINQMAERAVAMANEAPDDPFVGLAERAQLAANVDSASLELFDPSAEPDPKELQEEACEAEASALAVAGVSQVQSASAGYGRRRIHLTASNGFSAGYTRSDRGLSCVAISGEGTGMERDYDYDSRVFQNEMRGAAEIGRIAAERAVARAGARKPKTGAFPVLFDQRIAGSLVGHLLQATNGAAVARGSSWLRDSIGEQVLPKTLSIIEEPHRKRMPSSRLFDAEGLATNTRAIVENGTLTGWTLDLATARKLGMESTANGVRGISSPPSPSLSNISLTQGDQSRDALIAQMGTGLLVTSMIGSTINPNTGDYSRGASGFWIENGEIAYPVNECTVAGNLRDMLLAMTPANDAKTYLSHVVPSILIEGLTLAGE